MSSSNAEKIQITSKNLKKLKFDDNGLIPAIVQDYKNKEVVGSDIVKKTELIKFVPGFSTSNIVQRIIKAYGCQ